MSGAPVSSIIAHTLAIAHAALQAAGLNIENTPAWIAAQTAWAEARDQGTAGMQGVLNVIGNRVAHPKWWGHDIISVCLDPWQFSCWNPDANSCSDHQKMLVVGLSDKQFTAAYALAQRLVAGSLPDITNGSDSYYAVSIAPPFWVPSAIFEKQIAGQRFYHMLK